MVFVVVRGIGDWYVDLDCACDLDLFTLLSWLERGSCGRSGGWT